MLQGFENPQINKKQILLIQDWRTRLQKVPKISLEKRSFSTQQQRGYLYTIIQDLNTLSQYSGLKNQPINMKEAQGNQIGIAFRCFKYHFFDVLKSTFQEDIIKALEEYIQDLSFNVPNANEKFITKLQSHQNKKRGKKQQKLIDKLNSQGDIEIILNSFKENLRLLNLLDQIQMP